MGLFRRSESTRWLRDIANKVGFCGSRYFSANGAYELNTGYLIDWLDAPPAGLADIDKAIKKLWNASYPLGAIISHAHAVRGGHHASRFPMELDLRPGEGPYYGTGFHFGVVAHMDPATATTAALDYERLLRVDPESLSAISNLAEWAWRSGEQDRCRSLLERGLEIASTSRSERYTVAASDWVLPLTCQNAELGDELEGTEEFLSCATSSRLDDLCDLIRTADDQSQSFYGSTAPALFAAYSRASFEQRVCLRVAMQRMPVRPKPFPSHALPGEIAEFERMLVETR